MGSATSSAAVKMSSHVHECTRRGNVDVQVDDLYNSSSRSECEGIEAIKGLRSARRPMQVWIDAGSSGRKALSTSAYSLQASRKMVSRLVILVKSQGESVAE